jgi:cytochrome c oxidase accessory protein FixG
MSTASSDSRPPSPVPGDAEEGVAQEIDWGDYRDHIATADREGNRRWLYPKRPRGDFYRWRTWMSWVLLAVMFTGPFVRINGNPLLMMNIVERKFSILGQIFWPEDTIIFAVAMLVFLTGIVIFTTAFGRLWCGWTCPQTVLMEMVFRKIEYWIEGDGPAQKALDAAPWTAGKLARKLTKWSVFFGLSFLIGNTLLSYIIGSDALYEIITDNPREHLVGLGFMLAFTLLFFSIFARFREQACTFICPYGRFQSAMLDDNSMIVAYDYRRGEKRGALKRNQPESERRAEGAGDCVNCRQCVAVCPTGIDIRDGLQMECVNCAACIDACDVIMDKVGQPRGLIRYASHNVIEKGEPQRFTTRMGVYLAVLTALITVFLTLVALRADVETLLLRAPGGLFQTLPDGRVQNLYTLKVVNKASRDIPLTLRIENGPGEVSVMGGKFVVPKEDLAKTSVLIKLPPEAMTGAKTRLEIGVYEGEKLLETVKTVFVGPRGKK